MDNEELILVLEPDGNSSRQTVNQSFSNPRSPAAAEQLDIPSITKNDEADRQEQRKTPALSIEDNNSAPSSSTNPEPEVCKPVSQSKLCKKTKDAEATNEMEEEEKLPETIQEQQQPVKSQEELDSGIEKKREDGKEKEPTPDRKSTVSTSSTSDLYSDGSSSTVEVFEVEAIMGHKLVKGKTLFKVRWQNFGPKDDTWEPEENLAANPILTKTIENYWANKKSEKQKKEEIKKESPKQPKVEDEEVEDNDKDDDEAQDSSWYGIKPHEGPKEIRRLFVADRVPTETEKKLAEIKPGVRVLRNHLRNQTTDPIKYASPTPERIPSKRSQTARKNVIAKPKPSEWDEETTSDHGTPPVSVERRGRPKKKSREERATTEDLNSSHIRNSESLKDVFTCEDKSTTIQQESTKQEEKSDQPASEPKLKRDQLPALKPPRKRARKSNFGQEKEDEQHQNTATSSCGQHKSKASSSYRIANSARPTSTTARPPATLTKVKLEAIKRPIQRTSEEQIASSRKSGTLPSAIKPSTSSSSPAKPLMEDKWTAKQKRFYSLDLPIETTKTKDVGQWINQQTTKLELIELTQQEFEEAVMDGKVDRVRAALKTEKVRLDVNEVDANGRTLLHKVCEVKCGMTHTQCELIDILVASGARMDAKETVNGQIPLHVAIINRRLCHVRKLLALRSPVNTPDYSDQPPIVTAFNCSDAEFINALLNAGATFQPAFRAKPATNKHLLKRVLSHQTRLQTCFDKARQTITSNMMVSPVSPIFVNPLYEAREIEHSFRVDDATLPGPHCAYMVFTCLCDFSTDRLDSRMWSSSPVFRISINNRDCRLLQEKSKFVFLAALRTGFNMLNIELNVSQCDSNDLKLLTQVCLVQLQKTGNSQHTRPVAPVQPTMLHNLAAGSGGM